jgi:hypothetical protein
MVDVGRIKDAANRGCRAQADAASGLISQFQTEKVTHLFAEIG